MNYVVRRLDTQYKEEAVLLTYNEGTWIFTDINKAHQETYWRSVAYPRYLYVVEEYYQ